MPHRKPESQTCAATTHVVRSDPWPVTFSPLPIESSRACAALVVSRSQTSGFRSTCPADWVAKERAGLLVSSACLRKSHNIACSKYQTGTDGVHSARGADRCASATWRASSWVSALAPRPAISVAISREARAEPLASSNFDTSKPALQTGAYGSEGPHWLGAHTRLEPQGGPPSGSHSVQGKTRLSGATHSIQPALLRNRLFCVNTVSIVCA